MIRLYLILGACAAFLLFGVYIRHVIIENHSLKAELATAHRTADALDQAAGKKQEIFNTERNRIDDIENSPDGDDGPVAPVLRRALDGMR